MLCMGMKQAEGKVYEQSDIKKLKKETGNLQFEQVPGINDVTAEMYMRKKLELIGCISCVNYPSKGAGLQRIQKIKK